MDWTNIHAWKSKSLFAHNIQKNRKDVKPYPIKLDNGPLSLAICLGTMVATMFMFFAKVPVATVCLTAYYYICLCFYRVATAMEMDKNLWTVTNCFIPTPRTAHGSRIQQPMDKL